MGSGKSSVGRIVAEQLRFQFVDTDDLVESQIGKTIPEIFAAHGEPMFRDYERRALESLVDRENLVIATGGGAVINPDNMAGLKKHCLVVCLWASPETIWHRVRSQTHRPLLRTDDPPAKIRELLNARSDAYRSSDVLIQTEFRSPREVAIQVLHHYRSQLQGR